jgi:hypothetical protein
MKGICWLSSKMGSTLKYITLEPSILGVTLFILVYLSVYISFPMCQSTFLLSFPLFGKC